MMFIVDLGMQARCQVFHLLFLTEPFQQLCEVGITSILQKLQGLREFKPNITYLGKGIAELSSRSAYFESLPWREEAGARGEKKNDTLQ